MKVEVKWLKSPRIKFSIPRAPGTISMLDVMVAKKIIEEEPGMFESLELDNLEDKPKEKLIKVEDTMQKEARTRPVIKKLRDKFNR